jgi:succinate dehydrogenase / fumarate reductase cytochrome b subunit
MPEMIRPRPGTMRLLDAMKYRLPASGWVSILHRVSGALLVLLLPFVIWLLDVSLSSEVSYERFTSAFAAGIGFVPAWGIKLVVLVMIWAYLHHFIAGVRHLWMDATHSVGKQQGARTAVLTIVISLLLTVALGAKLFGVY